MCGICGIVGYRNYGDIARMTEILSHRGPDNIGVKVFENDRVALGHTRLSILDLSPRGHQPMSDKEGRYWITYKGELYNYKEIKKELENKGYIFQTSTDTEVIIYAYMEWGTNCLTRFNGMFAFAIWDIEDKTLFLARDRIGIKPVYYHKKDNTLFFASEIKSIIQNGYVEKELDYESLYTPSMYQISPNTGFRNIYKLEPGTYMIFNDGRLSKKKYWEINPSEKGISKKKAVEELYHLLNR